MIADLDDGYTRIANELLEAITFGDFSKREIKIIWAVIRKTYGYHKKEDRLSNSQLSELTDIKRGHISMTVNSLVDKKVLLKRTTGNSLILKLNKNINDWKTKKRPQNSSDIDPKTEAESPPIQGQNAPNSGAPPESELPPKQGQGAPKTGAKLPPKQGIQKKKDNIQKKLYPDWLDVESWEKFAEFRKTTKPKMTEYGEKLLLTELKKLIDQGGNQKRIIERSIMNGWKGLFPDRQADAKPAPHQTQFANSI